MTECIKARQWLYRALRTAVQAAAGVVAANLAAWVSGITDGASVKTVAINAGAGGHQRCVGRADEYGAAV